MEVKVKMMANNFIEMDQRNRLTIPIKLRRLHNIKAGDAFKVSVDNGTVTLQSVVRTCAFCGSRKHLSDFRNRSICKKCKDKLYDELSAEHLESRLHELGKAEEVDGEESA